MKIQIHYVKCLAKKCLCSSIFPLSLYINKHFTLPSLCEASHKDGWGEGYEQRPRKTDYGDLYVSFWEHDGFFIRTKEEMEAARVPTCPRPQRGDNVR